jgi:hypothetical protein
MPNVAPNTMSRTSESHPSGTEYRRREVVIDPVSRAEPRFQAP